MDGYPSEPELQAIRTFHGTPRAFIEYVGSIWRNGAGWGLELVDDEMFDRKEWRATFITGGWSGCEEVIDAVRGTFFDIMFASKWERGGLWEYQINEKLIHVEMDLGVLTVDSSEDA